MSGEHSPYGCCCSCPQSTSQTSVFSLNDGRRSSCRLSPPGQYEGGELHTKNSSYWPERDFPGSRPQSAPPATTTSMRGRLSLSDIGGGINGPYGGGGGGGGSQYSIISGGGPFDGSHFGMRGGGGQSGGSGSSAADFLSRFGRDQSDYNVNGRQFHGGGGHVVGQLDWGRFRAGGGGGWDDGGQFDRMGVYGGAGGVYGGRGISGLYDEGQFGRSGFFGGGGGGRLGGSSFTRSLIGGDLRYGGNGREYHHEGNHPLRSNRFGGSLSDYEQFGGGGNGSYYDVGNGRSGGGGGYDWSWNEFSGGPPPDNWQNINGESGGHRKQKNYRTMTKSVSSIGMTDQEERRREPELFIAGLSPEQERKWRIAFIALLPDEEQQRNVNGGKRGRGSRASVIGGTRRDGRSRSQSRDSLHSTGSSRSNSNLQGGSEGMNVKGASRSRSASSLRSGTRLPEGTQRMKSSLKDPRRAQSVHRVSWPEDEDATPRNKSEEKVARGNSSGGKEGPATSGGAASNGGGNNKNGSGAMRDKGQKGSWNGAKQVGFRSGNEANDGVGNNRPGSAHKDRGGDVSRSRVNRRATGYPKTTPPVEDDDDEMYRAMVRMKSTTTIGHKMGSSGTGKKAEDSELNGAKGEGGAGGNKWDAGGPIMEANRRHNKGVSFRGSNSGPGSASQSRGGDVNGRVTRRATGYPKTQPGGDDDDGEMYRVVVRKKSTTTIAPKVQSGSAGNKGGGSIGAKGEGGAGGNKWDSGGPMRANGRPGSANKKGVSFRGSNSGRGSGNQSQGADVNRRVNRRATGYPRTQPAENEMYRATVNKESTTTITPKVGTLGTGNKVKDEGSNGGKREPGATGNTPDAAGLSGTNSSSGSANKSNGSSGVSGANVRPGSANKSNSSSVSGVKSRPESANKSSNGASGVSGKNSRPGSASKSNGSGLSEVNSSSGSGNNVKSAGVSGKNSRPGSANKSNNGVRRVGGIPRQSLDGNTIMPEDDEEIVVVVRKKKIVTTIDPQSEPGRNVQEHNEPFIVHKESFM